MTLAPSLANNLAIPAPIPRPEPVTTATLPSNAPMCRSSPAPPRGTPCLLPAVPAIAGCSHSGDHWLPSARQDNARRARRGLLACWVLCPYLKVDQVLAVLDGLGGDDAPAGDVLVRVVHASVLAPELLDAARGGDPVVEELSEEGVLQRAVDDDVLQASVSSERLVVVDLVEVAGGAGPDDELLGRAVLPE